MDQDVERFCKGCYECQLVSAPSRPPLLSSIKMPDKPWEHVACDLLSPLPNGESILVVVDFCCEFMLHFVIIGSV